MSSNTVLPAPIIEHIPMSYSWHHSLHIFLTPFFANILDIIFVKICTNHSIFFTKSNIPWVRRSFRELILSTSPLMSGTLAWVATPPSSCINLVTINSSRRSTSKACGLRFPWTTFWGSYCSRQQLAWSASKDEKTSYAPNGLQLGTRQGIRAIPMTWFPVWTACSIVTMLVNIKTKLWYFKNMYCLSNLCYGIS